MSRVGMKVFGLEAFEDMMGTVPQAAPGDPPSVGIITANCHPGSPVYLVYTRGSGKVGMKCCFCGEIAAEILVARSLIILPRGNGRE